ncbi:MAG: SusC/RagA family TonB-linked outer membrane protein, partial [Tannerellaceae bacterium]|nr:SusC/RagA family TonB-linked outer membrane protein [Tannerellaceae bacterium]
QGNITYFDELWEVNPNEGEDVLKNPNKRNTHVTSYNMIGYKSLGYYTSEEDVVNSPRLLGSTNLRPGDIKYADLDGNGYIDSNDQVRLGKGYTPRFTYGINVNLGYKGFFLYALFQGSGKRDFNMGDGTINGRNGVVHPYHKDYWTPENTGALLPRLLSSPLYNNDNNYQTSDFWLVDASYFRLKSLQVGYDFKKKLLTRIPFVSTAKIILSGSNLLTFSKTMDFYYDPESGTGSNHVYPLQRTYSLTINLGF